VQKTKTILVAENDLYIYTFYNEVLTAAGYNVVWAEDGKKAINIFENRDDIDLVLMDIEMPIIDGYQATAKIKEINSEIPVIILTAYDLRSAKETAEKANCNLFLTKPIRSKDLLSSVSEFLD